MSHTLSMVESEFIIAAARDALVIWDFDGVIMDSEPLQAESYRVLLADWDNNLDDFDFRRYLGYTEAQIWNMILEAGYQLDGSIAEVMETRRKWFRRQTLHKLEPTWIVRELGQLFESLRLRQVIVSSGVPTFIDEYLVEWNLSSLERLTPETLPGGKRELLTNLWKSGKTITIEDNPDYLEAAGRAGSWCVGIRHSLNSETELSCELEIEL